MLSRVATPLFVTVSGVVVVFRLLPDYHRFSRPGESICFASSGGQTSSTASTNAKATLTHQIIGEPTTSTAAPAPKKNVGHSWLGKIAATLKGTIASGDADGTTNTSAPRPKPLRVPQQHLREYLARAVVANHGHCASPSVGTHVCHDFFRLVTERQSDGRRQLRTDPTTCATVVGEVLCKVKANSTPCTCHDVKKEPFYDLPGWDYEAIKAGAGGGKTSDGNKKTTRKRVLKPFFGGEGAGGEGRAAPGRSSSPAPGAARPSPPAFSSSAIGGSRLLPPGPYRRRASKDEPREDQATSCSACSSCPCEFVVQNASMLFNYFNVVRDALLNQVCRILTKRQLDHTTSTSTSTKKPFLRVLAIGLGVGWVQQTLARISPLFDILTVELDAGMVAVANRFYGLQNTINLGWKDEAEVYLPTVPVVPLDRERAAAAAAPTSAKVETPCSADRGRVLLKELERKLFTTPASASSSPTSSTAAPPAAGRNRVVVSDGLAFLETNFPKASGPNKGDVADHEFDLMLVDCFDPLGYVPQPSCAGARFGKAAFGVLNKRWGVLLQNTLPLTKVRVESGLRKAGVFRRVAVQTVPMTPNLLVVAEAAGASSASSSR